MSAADVPEEELKQDSKLEMAQKLFLLRSADASAEEKLQIQNEVLVAIKQDGEAYRLLACTQSLCGALARCQAFCQGLLDGPGFNQEVRGGQIQVPELRIRDPHVPCRLRNPTVRRGQLAVCSAASCAACLGVCRHAAAVSGMLQGLRVAEGRSPRQCHGREYRGRDWEAG